MSDFGFSTRAIHVGSEPDASTSAVIPAISLSTTFKQSEVGVHKGFEYSRSQNPSRLALEQTLAALEAGGANALAFASGSATTATVIQSLGAGAHVLSVNDVYGGTYRYLTNVATAQGVEVTFLDMEVASDQEIVDAIRPNTKLIWIESPTNPTLRFIDIDNVSKLVASKHPNRDTRPIILVDNTFASPFYSSPLLHGADVVLHSLTKYINGHSDVVGGALILPNSPFHNRLTEKLTYLQNAIGAIPSPFDSWLAQRGAKTLGVRMKQHGLNALYLARYLENSSLVVPGSVIYPGLPSYPKQGVAWKHLSPHAAKFLSAEHTREAGFPFSGMLSFRPRGDVRTFLSSLKVFTLAESLGGVESLAELPAAMTHGGIPRETREKIGIYDNLVRLSVGIEEAEDLVADVERALKIANGVPVSGEEQLLKVKPVTDSGYITPMSDVSDDAVEAGTVSASA